MIGIWSEYSQQYLIAWAVLSSVVFTIPLFCMPIAWARVLQWNIPGDTDLAIYFGRCLGGLGLAVCGLALHAGLTGQGTVVVFNLLFGGFGFITIAHVWGAIQRIQPITETLEIAFWIALVLLNAAFYPAA